MNEPFRARRWRKISTRITRTSPQGDFGGADDDFQCSNPKALADSINADYDHYERDIAAIQHQEIAAAQVEFNAMRNRAIAAETELHDLKLAKWEYIETADGHYARHKEHPGRTLGPMTRRLAQEVVAELNKH